MKLGAVLAAVEGLPDVDERRLPRIGERNDA